MRIAAVWGVAGLIAGLVVGATVVAPRLYGTAVGVLPSPAVTNGESLGPLMSGDHPAVGANTAFQRWIMGSVYPPSLPQLGTLAKRFEDGVWRVSGGTMEIRPPAPGTPVPSGDMFEAVALGAMDAAFIPPGTWAGAPPALRLFAGVPFGPDAVEYLAWIDFGGGRELMDALYGPLGVRGILCGLAAPDAAGWFRHEIRTVEDLNGLAMGIDGLGAKVLEKLGVRTMALAGGDLFLAFEKRAIDAAAFSMPAVDLKLGFHEMAKHYYFPGWQRPFTPFHLIVNGDLWNTLEGSQRAMIETVCGDNVRHGLAEGAALQYAALKVLTAKGIQIRRWPDRILADLEKTWEQVAATEASADADFGRVWQSLVEFRRRYAVWLELAIP